MEIKSIDSSSRALINDFIEQHWYSTTMIVREKQIDLKEAEGFFISENNSIVGLITFFVHEKVLEITSLDSLRKNCGIGTKLVKTVIAEAQKRGCEKITLITTNDNINAISFYQKRGFDMVRIFRNAVDAARKLKPEIPLIGENNIPLRHEIEFELLL